MWRAAVIAVLCVGVLVAVGYRNCSRPHHGGPQVQPTSAAMTVKRPDPATLVRGAIVGTVRDDAGAIAGARICVTAQSRELDAQLLRDLPCVTTGARGEYRIAALLPTHYLVHASAKQHQPATAAIDVAGEMTIDLILPHGGVELTGVISDLSGGPIAQARVLADPAITETAADGTFSVWVSPGSLEIVVTAEGYAPLVEHTSAPRHVELALVPEGIVTGTVVDAKTKAPIEGVRVTASVKRSDGTLTDAHGSFRLSRLRAGAMDLVATSPTGYGRTAGSIVVGVGATTTGVVIELHQAVTVTGHVIFERAPCGDASVTLREIAKAREVELHAHRNAMIAEGVLPGTYEVEVQCEGAIARDEYPKLVVGSEHVEATWEVDRGGRIEGRVTTRAGAPVDRRGVVAHSLPPAPWWWRKTTTDAEGRYAITAIPPGKVDIRASEANGDGVRKQVGVTRGGVVQQDFVVDEVGRIRGVVRDEGGRPVSGYLVIAKLDAEERIGLSDTTDARGAYAIEEVPPGAYVLVAHHPHRAELAHTPVTVQANQIARGDITVKRPGGSITGIVVDSAKRPVADVFVKIARETDNVLGVWDELRGDRGERAITDVDGAFAIHDVPEGTYTVRAFRSAGPDAIAEHVMPNATLKLQLRSTGSITGVVRSWSSTLDDLRIYIEDRRIGYHRSEHFFRTGGTFVLDELPAGHYKLAAGAEGQETQIEIDLAEGERKQNIEITLVPLVTITGRVVDHLTKQPVAGISVFTTSLGASTRFSGGDHPTSDANGRFTIKRVPLGQRLINCHARDTHETWTTRIVQGTGIVDIGDIPVMRERNHGEVSGESGLELEDLDFDDISKVVVEKVVVNSPAAKGGIVPGDVITSIDGVDMHGFGAINAWNALVAPPGTKLAITLARGVTVEIVLASSR